MSEGKSERGPDRDRDPEGSGGSGPDRAKAPGGGESAEGRRKGPAPGASKKAPSGRTALTESQRRRARELRRRRDRSSGRGRTSSGASTGNVLSRGIKATATETGRALAFIGRAIAALMARAASVFLILIGAILSVGGALLELAGRLVATVAGALARAALALDRVLTPARAVIAASVLAAVLLGVSQFLDYRAVEIGSAGYDPILDLTRAPRTDVETPIGAHSIVLLVGAIAALACLPGLVRTGRRSFALPIVVVGLLALVVGLAIDLPRGLDSAAASAAYADADAVLLAGFWLEIASGVTLAATGILLAIGPTVEAAGSRERPARTDRRRRRSRAAAGGAT